MKNRCITIRQENGTVRITINDPITMNNYLSVETLLLKTIQESAEESFIIDLSALPALYSSGVGLIVHLNSIAKDLGKAFGCITANKKMFEGFILMGLDKIITLYESEDHYERGISTPKS